MADKKPDIQLVDAGRSKKYTLGAINSVVQHASPLVFDSVEAKKHVTRNRANGESFYGRRGTLTHFSLQQAMCELRGDANYVPFPCEAAAVTNPVLTFVEQSNHVLVANTAYEPNQDLCNGIPNKLGATTLWFDSLIGADIVKHLQPDTKIVFLESPDSITMEVHDVPTIVAAVRGVVPDAITMIDNTWVADVLSKALDLDIDVSIQATIKYLVGHSDAMTGTAVCNVRCQEQLRENACLMGQMADTDTACIASCGLRALGARLRQYHENSLKVAEWLTEHPQVARTDHSALPNSKGYEFWKRDSTDSSELSSFVLKKKLNDEELANYLGSFSLFNMAYSWGGYESLILTNQPEYIAAIRPQGRIDFSETSIRLYIDLEGIDDLVADLNAGFARIV